MSSIAPAFLKSIESRIINKFPPYKKEYMGPISLAFADKIATNEAEKLIT